MQGTVQVPDVIPVFPLPRTVLLPGEILPLHIFEPRYRAMVSDALKTHRVIGMVEHLPTTEKADEASQLRSVGCVGFIGQHRRLADGRYLIWLLGLERFSVETELETDEPYRMCRVNFLALDDRPEGLAANVPLTSEIRALLPGLLALDEETRSSVAEHIEGASEQQLVAVTAQLLEMPSQRKQQLLEADSVRQQLMMVIEDLYRRSETMAAVAGLEGSPLN
jgi:Lon protease-like protein